MQLLFTWSPFPKTQGFISGFDTYFDRPRLTFLPFQSTNPPGSAVIDAITLSSSAFVPLTHPDLHLKVTPLHLSPRPRMAAPLHTHCISDSQAGLASAPAEGLLGCILFSIGIERRTSCLRKFKVVIVCIKPGNWQRKNESRKVTQQSRAQQSGSHWDSTQRYPSRPTGNSCPGKILPVSLGIFLSSKKILGN